MPHIQGWQEILVAESNDRPWAVIIYMFFCFGDFSSSPPPHTYTYTYVLIHVLIQKIWGTSLGENSRFYHAFQCEDFVGRFTEICAMCHKTNMERSVLDRLYMGLVEYHQNLAYK